MIWYDRAIVPVWSPVIDRAKFTALKKELGEVYMGWDATDWKMHWSRGRKITWCGKTLKGVIKFHSRAGDWDLLHWKAKQGVQCSRKGRKKIGRYDLLYRQAWKRHEQRQRSRSIWELRFVPQGMEEEDSDFMFLYWIVLLPWWGYFDRKFAIRSFLHW